jgi:hypothetical protein
MSELIKNQIYEQVKQHQVGVKDMHVEIITNEIYKQLSEIFSAEQIEVIAKNLSSEFSKIIDALVPIVEEYEQKIDAEINVQISKLLDIISQK